MTRGARSALTMQRRSFLLGTAASSAAVALGCNAPPQYRCHITLANCSGHSLETNLETWEWTKNCQFGTLYDCRDYPWENTPLQLSLRSLWRQERWNFTTQVPPLPPNHYDYSLIITLTPPMQLNIFWEDRWPDSWVNEYEQAETFRGKKPIPIFFLSESLTWHTQFNFRSTAIDWNSLDNPSRFHQESFPSSLTVLDEHSDRCMLCLSLHLHHGDPPDHYATELSLGELTSIPIPEISGIVVQHQEQNVVRIAILGTETPKITQRSIFYDGELCRSLDWSAPIELKLRDNLQCAFSDNVYPDFRFEHEIKLAQRE